MTWMIPSKILKGWTLAIRIARKDMTMGLVKVCRGSYYEVEHDDKTIGFYGPEELVIVKE